MASQLWGLRYHPDGEDTWATSALSATCLARPWMTVLGSGLGWCGHLINTEVDGCSLKILHMTQRFLQVTCPPGFSFSGSSRDSNHECESRGLPEIFCLLHYATVATHRKSWLLWMPFETSFNTGGESIYGMLNPLPPPPPEVSFCWKTSAVLVAPYTN